MARQLIELDPTERLGPDDMATRTEAEYLAAALAQHQRVAQAVAPACQGVCTNCGAPCLPRAVYCDEHCRADHELRERQRAIQGRAE